MEEKKVSFSDAPLISVGTIARVGIFSALGVILGYISLFVPILGQQVKLDFSHLGTMFAAVFLGPFAGAITGGIVGIPPSLQFGNYLIAPIKLLTGLIVGLVMKKVKIPSLAIVLGFIPESLPTYIMGTGVGTLTDSLSALKYHVYTQKNLSMREVMEAIRTNFENNPQLRQILWEKSPRFGNDDPFADQILQDWFNLFFNLVAGRPNTRGGNWYINFLSTTVHVYFGSKVGATPDGRRAYQPLSDGISPTQGTDRKGPTAVIKSASKMDHARTGGTLLNMKFTPKVLEGENIKKLAQLIRAYFALDGHHVQFNVVNAETLKAAQVNPEAYRDLIVRVAGYSDYFCDLTKALQDEIIARTEHEI